MIFYAAMAALLFSLSAGMVISILIARAERAKGQPQDDVRTMFTGGCLGVFIFIGVMVLVIALVVILDQ